MPLRRITEKQLKYLLPSWFYSLHGGTNDFWNSSVNTIPVRWYVPAQIHAKNTDITTQNCTFDLNINVNLSLTCPLLNTDSHASTLFIFVLKWNLHHTSGKRSMFPSNETPNLNNYQYVERSNFQINKKKLHRNGIMKPAVSLI